MPAGASSVLFWRRWAARSCVLRSSPPSFSLRRHCWRQVTSRQSRNSGIADGSIIATVAITEESGSWVESGVSLQATEAADGYVLNGHKSYVIDGLVADLIIVPARTAAGIGLFTVQGDANGLTKTSLKTFDLTRKLARLDFTDVPAQRLGADGDGWKVLETVLDFAAIGLAAEQTGGAQAALDMAVEYAKIRIQFGQPIGSFQAIKHKCADMLLEVESAKSASYYALWAATERNTEFAASASLAKAYCSDAFVSTAHENIQIHGGYRLHLGKCGRTCTTRGPKRWSFTWAIRSITVSALLSASGSSVAVGQRARLIEERRAVADAHCTRKARPE